MLRRADIKVLGLKLFIYKKVGILKHMKLLLIKTNKKWHTYHVGTESTYHCKQILSSFFLGRLFTKNFFGLEVPIGKQYQLRLYIYSLNI